MRHSEFWQLMADEFGTGYAQSVARDQTLTELHGKCAEQALADGQSPKEVWLALCRHMGVPEHRWLGKDRPPKPGVTD